MTSWSILTGDVRERLADIPAGTARTCVTSPPYWGLRDYGTGTWAGGDPACEHIAGYHHREQPNRPTQDGVFRHTSVPQPVAFRDVCEHCGAVREDQQIGLESTPEEYVSAIVDVFREVRRVIADDGTLWLNLGDSYAHRASGRDGRGRDSLDRPLEQRQPFVGARHAPRPPGFKSKDLIGIPWMVAFALRADGWYLRSDVIWHKPNPMPESITDRPSSAHEHVFLFAKSPRYFYDADAVREPHTMKPQRRPSGRPADDIPRANQPTQTWSTAQRDDVGVDGDPRGRNARNVWTVPTQPYAGAHFATFPPKLIEPCILAGSAEGDTVLDPFTGSGTTAMVALRHGRAFVGTELNPQYVDLARERINGDAPLFNTPAEVAA